MSNKNLMIIKVAGGLGNKIFMLFCGLSLAIDNNLIPILDLNSQESKRSQFTKYYFFNSEHLIKKIIKNYNNLQTVEEKRFEYDEIKLKPNKDYLLNQELSGYFQSYKYFWHNIEKIKEYFYVDYEKITKCKKFLEKKGPYIALHMRLTDYLSRSEYHYNVKMEYYKNILSKYDLTNTKVLLFSDDVELAQKLLYSCIQPDNIVLADSFSTDDEDQIYLMSCTGTRICANSTYSLWSCYLNEMYNFNSESQYYFPTKWFGSAGPKFNMYDIVPESNPKYILIDTC